MECSAMRRGYFRGFTASEKTELWDRWQRGEYAESDWASVWEAIIVNLFSAGPTRGNSSPATAPLKAGIDTRRARGNIQSYSARSIGAIDSQVAGPLALVGEQRNQPQWAMIVTARRRPMSRPGTALVVRNVVNWRPIRGSGGALRKSSD